MSLCSAYGTTFLCKVNISGCAGNIIIGVFNSIGGSVASLLLDKVRLNLKWIKSIITRALGVQTLSIISCCVVVVVLFIYIHEHRIAVGLMTLIVPPQG